MDVPSLIDIARLLATGAGVGVIVSFLMERVAWFQGLSSQVRWWVILGISLGLPVLATVLLQALPAEVWMAVEPFWNALAAGFLVWLSGQAFHKQDRAR